MACGVQKVQIWSFFGKNLEIAKWENARGMESYS
jgi:hypothetical protein